MACFTVIIFTKKNFKAVTKERNMPKCSKCGRFMNPHKVKCTVETIWNWDKTEPLEDVFTHDKCQPKN